MSIKIIISKHQLDYHATIEDDNGDFGVGENVYEAVGDLIYSRLEKFDIQVIESYKEKD